MLIKPSLSIFFINQFKKRILFLPRSHHLLHTYILKNLSNDPSECVPAMTDIHSKPRSVEFCGMHIHRLVNVCKSCKSFLLLRLKKLSNRNKVDAGKKKKKHKTEDLRSSKVLLHAHISYFACVEFSGKFFQPLIINLWRISW